MLDDLSRQQQLIILGLCILIISGLMVMFFRHFFASTNEAIVIEQPKVSSISTTPVDKSIIVHLSGAVKRAGVYKLKSGDRIIDLINLAGGVSQLADLSAINLADKVKDGQKITIPALKRASGNQEIREFGPNKPGKININLAGQSELCKIKGIGKSMAARIIDHRAKNGPFSKLDGLMKVKGIGKGKFKKIKDEIII